MGISSMVGKYGDGVLKAGIPFGIVQLVLFCVFMMALDRCYRLADESYYMWEPHGLGNSIYTQTLLAALVLSACLLAAFAAASFAGAASARINRITGIGDAKKNGIMTGLVLWLFVVLTVAVIFWQFTVFILRAMASPQNYRDGFAIGLTLIILACWILLPILWMLWAFIKFSIAGSAAWVQVQSSPVGTSRGLLQAIKGGMVAGGMLWAKTAFIALALIWPLILVFMMIVKIFSMHN